MKSSIIALACLVLIDLVIFMACQSAPLVTPVPVQGVPTSGVIVPPGTVPGFKPEWVTAMDSALQGGLLEKFDLAADDMVRFCPKYKLLPGAAKIRAWEYLFSGVVKFESDYGPSSAMTESDGSVSQGLFQLTYGDSFCPKSKAQGDLNDPIVNIKCALSLSSNLVANDGLVAAGGYVSHGAPPPKGMAKYWSVLRVPDSKSHHHLADIQAMTAKAPGCQ